VSLPKSKQASEARARALEAVSLMRSKGLTLSEAARRSGTTPATVQKYAASALRSEPDRVSVRASDQLVREMTLPTPDGKQVVRVKGSRDASQVGEYWNAVADYLQTGDRSGLSQFEGETIRDSRGQTWQFLTDLRVLRRLGQAGVLSFEDIYQVTA
jgi:transcriptional regulator with XRE-family HTH domain